MASSRISKETYDQTQLASKNVILRAKSPTAPRRRPWNGQRVVALSFWVLRDACQCMIMIMHVLPLSIVPFHTVSLVFSQPFLSPKQELSPLKTDMARHPSDSQRPKPTFQEPADWRRHRISKVLRASWFARVASGPVMRAPGTWKPPGSGDLDMWPGWNLQQLGYAWLDYFIFLYYFGEVSWEFRHGSEKEQCLRYPDYNLRDKYQSYNRLREELGMYIDVFQSVGQTSLQHFNLEHGWPLDFPTVDVAG